jgi:hypothetical protein
MYPSTFGSVPTCVHMSYRPNELLAPQAAEEAARDKNLEQRINSEFSVQIGDTIS